MSISMIILYGILGFATSAAGLKVDSWGFWIVLLTTIAVDINSHRLAMKDVKNGR